MGEFTIGLMVGVVFMMAYAGPRAWRSNTTLRRLYNTCGNVAESVKYSDHRTFERLRLAMENAERRHRGLEFREERTLSVLFLKDDAPQDVQWKCTSNTEANSGRGSEGRSCSHNN